MKLEDAPPNKRPNLYHTHDEDVRGVTHVHDIVDHYGRTFEQITHTHNEDLNVTVGDGRHKPPKRIFTDD